MAMKKKKFGKATGSTTFKRPEAVASITQESRTTDTNKADKSLANLMNGKVFPSYGKKATRPTGANKDRRTK